MNSHWDDWGTLSPGLWRQTDEVVDLTTAVLVPQPDEDNPTRIEVWKSRRAGRRPRARPTPTQLRDEYYRIGLVKERRAAIHERLYAVMAGWLGIPSQVVNWAVARDRAIRVFIRWEDEAIEGEMIQVVPVPILAPPGSLEPIPVANPDDLIRHVALSSFCEERRVVRFVVRKGTAVRIAASAILPPRPEGGYEFGDQPINRGLFLRQQAPALAAVYLETLRRLVFADDLVERLSADLARCPVRIIANTRAYLLERIADEQAVLRTRWAELAHLQPEMDVGASGPAGTAEGNSPAQPVACPGGNTDDAGNGSA